MDTSNINSEAMNNDVEKSKDTENESAILQKFAELKDQPKFQKIVEEAEEILTQLPENN